MSTRKRTRTTEPPDTNLEEDELSTPQRKFNISTDALGTSKRRKLNGTDNTSSVARIGKKIGDAVGGLFKGLKGKENTQESDEVDELADDVSLKQQERTSRGGKKKHVKDVFDFPSSGDEDTARRASPVKTTRIPFASGMKKTPRSVRDTAKGQLEGVWDVPDSEGKKNKSTTRSGGRPRNDTVVAAALEIPRSAPRMSSVRRKGKQNLEQEHEDEVDEAIAEIGEFVELDPRVRRTGSSRGKKKPPAIEADDVGESTIQVKLSPRHGRSKAILSSSPLPIPRSQPRSSTKKRGRPKNTLDQLVESVKVQESPRGILTPSRGRGLKSKKSVAFEKGDDDIDLGFKDIPALASSKKSGKSNDVAIKESVEAYGEEQDLDTACAVCLKKSTRKGNEILLCDGCDYGAHQKCLQMSKIPAGDWFCKSCQPGQSPVEELEVDNNDLVEPEELEEQEQKSRAIPGKDETSCAQCRGLASEKDNAIILCDSCDFAVHVKCYELPGIPKGDWLCRTCQAAAGEDPFNLGVEQEEVIVQPQTDIPDIEGFETHLRAVQRAVIDKLTGQRRIKLVGHDDEMQKVYQVVEQTVVAGEGNSMLVIGARGCGKTTLVESVISDVSREHSESFHVVRLNGFIHTDDKIASKEIWRQLGREMDVEEDGTKPSNYADTLASLLALLSHPSEQSAVNHDHTTKSVVFILDEFDLFTTHSRQTLLYNLFDIAQARKAPIVVLGLTTRIDVVESLEKRVKSRFSHRYVHLSLPKSVPAFWDTCKQGLLVDEEELENDDREDAGQAEFIAYWNSMIENLYTSDVSFKRHISTIFHRTKSASTFFTSLLLPLASLSLTLFPLTSSVLFTTTPLSPPSSKLYLLPSLSTLSLSLLICACRLDIIHDSELCNFAMVYDEYSSLTSKHKIQTSASGVTALGGTAKIWSKETSLMEWERLGEVGLLVGVGGLGGGGRKGEQGKGERLWRCDVGLEEIAGSVDMSTVLARWCREI